MFKLFNKLGGTKRIRKSRKNKSKQSKRRRVRGGSFTGGEDKVTGLPNVASRR
jgi:hypothetical protein